VSETCPTCGMAIVVGDYPFCPHGRAATSVIGDDVPGGFVVENGFDQPTRFFSKSEHRKALDAKGLMIKARWAGPNDRHLTRWDAVDAYTLEAARSLVDRSRVRPEPTHVITKHVVEDTFTARSER